MTKEKCWQNGVNLALLRSAGLVQNTCQYRGSPRGLFSTAAAPPAEGVGNRRPSPISGKTVRPDPRRRPNRRHPVRVRRAFVSRRDVPETMNENVRDLVILNAHRVESNPHDFLLNRSSKEITIKEQRFNEHEVSWRVRIFFFVRSEGRAYNLIKCFPSERNSKIVKVRETTNRFLLLEIDILLKHVLIGWQSKASRTFYFAFEKLLQRVKGDIFIVGILRIRI